MKARVELWVRLKVVDLVVQTAWMTMTEKLDLGGTLAGLSRYSYWRMDVEGPGREQILDEIDRVVRMDSAFTNQNKHLYLLKVLDPGVSRGGVRAGSSGGMPVSVTGQGGPSDGMSRGDLSLEKDLARLECGGVQGGAGEIHGFDCLIRELKSDRDRGYRERLNARLRNVEVTDLGAGEVWRILLRAGSREEAYEEVKRMVVTRSRREGLLINPHYQDYEILPSFEREGSERL